MEEEIGFDQRLYRDMMGLYPSGLTIVAGICRGRPVGFTCQSFHSVSVEPPLVLFGVMRGSESWPEIRENGRFSVNILAETQAELSSAFARKGVDRWEKVDWTEDAGGCPVISGSLVSLGCELYGEYEAGDHYIVVARVCRIKADAGAGDNLPLIFYRGRYRKIEAGPQA